MSGITGRGRHENYMGYGWMSAVGSCKRNGIYKKSLFSRSCSSVIKMPTTVVDAFHHASDDPVLRRCLFCIPLRHHLLVHEASGKHKAYLAYRCFAILPKNTPSIITSFHKFPFQTHHHRGYYCYTQTPNQKWARRWE